MAIFKFVFIFLVIFPMTHFVCGQEICLDDMLPKRIIVKLKPEHREKCNGSTITDSKWVEVEAYIDIEVFVQKFPKAEIPDKDKTRLGKPFVDITLIYEISYSKDVPLSKAIVKVKNTGLFEYAVPHILPKPMYVPNDADSNQNYWHKLIQVYKAWDIEKGDATVVIGITDTGIDLVHEDLVDNIAYNYGDPFPFNGLDDDNDGFVDNYRGWDLGDSNNTPQCEAAPYYHGTKVSGIAGAVTDNGIGVAGAGFHCKLLPIKISRGSTEELNAAYEGIVYAADHGCQIINCSWGDFYGTEYGQDIVNYATNNKNALIIASAGNKHNMVLYFPASYEGVLSVGATNSNDHKWYNPDTGSGSNYGYTLDMCAPGLDLYTTTNGGYYTSFGGTSFAAPLVAGCAALLKSKYPEFTARQLGEQLKVTTDTIDTISYNLPYAKLLGTGRLNIFRAMTETSHPAVNYEDIEYVASIGDTYSDNDTIEIHGNLINYLAQVTNLSATLSSKSNYVQIIDGTFSIDSLGVLETVPATFQVRLKLGFQSTLNNVLLLEFTGDNNYYGYQYLLLSPQKLILDLDTNNIVTSITSNGRIGYYDEAHTAGKGIVYQSLSNLLYEGGLITGNSPSTVATCFRYENNFSSITRPEHSGGDSDADVEIQSSFFETKLDLVIQQKALAWNSAGFDDFIIMEYSFINSSYNTISNFYAGLLFDWDILEIDKNKVNFDDSRNLSYTFYSQQGLHGGIKLLSNHFVNHYAIDLIPGGNGGIDIVDNFTDSEKYLILTNIRHEAGISGAGSDVVDLLCSGPYNIELNDTLTIAFAVLGGNDFADLIFNADNAQYLYDSITLGVEERVSSNKQLKLTVFPVPFSNELILEFDLQKKEYVELFLSDSYNRRVGSPTTGTYSSGNHRIVYDISAISPGLYFVNVQMGDHQEVRKVIKIN